MAKFFVTAKGQDGSPRSSVMEAKDIGQVVSSAQAQGLFVVNVQPLDEPKVVVNEVAQDPAFSAERKFSHTSVRLEDIVTFARQLATMLEAGVPLLRSLSVIQEQIDSRRLAQVIYAMKVDVEQGETFSKSMTKHPQVFGQFWVSLIEVGEASGTLPQILQKLTTYVEEDARFRSHIISALIYPAVLLFVCIAAILFFALFVGPTFEGIFKEMGTDLPGLTVAMLGFFKFIKTQFILIALVIAGLVFLFRWYVRTPAGRWQWEVVVFSMPLLGPVARLIVIERFTSQMAVLIDSGVPILYALEISERLVDNLICGQVVRQIREAVREGKLLAQPMDASGFFPPMAVQMVKVGEETGELGKMLNHIAKYYKQNIEDFMKRIGTLIEPVMLIIMGGIIGVIVISMFLPLFNLAGGGAR